MLRGPWHGQNVCSLCAPWWSSTAVAYGLVYEVDRVKELLLFAEFGCDLIL